MSLDPGGVYDLIGDATATVIRPGGSAPREAMPGRGLRIPPFLGRGLCFDNGFRLGIGFGHISNADIHLRNPGENDLMVT